MYSDFYGRVDNREYFAVEVLANQVNGSVEEAERDFRQHAARTSRPPAPRRGRPRRR
jgi:hypothetical protein